MRWIAYVVIIFLALAPILAGIAGHAIGSGVLHPMRLHPQRLEQTALTLASARATKENFSVRTSDGVELHGWKIHAPAPSGDWVLLFHGVSDNRTGTLGHAEFLLRHSYSVVILDSRAHGASGGDMATYGWKERYDPVAVAGALKYLQKRRLRSVGSPHD